MPTKLDIQKFVLLAKRHSKTKCPMALAIKAEDDDIAEVEVDGTMVTTTYRNGKKSYGDISLSVSNAIKQFDETGTWPEDVTVYHADPIEACLLAVFENHATELGTYKR